MLSRPQSALDEFEVIVVDDGSALAQLATPGGYIAEWTASRAAAAEEPANSLRHRRHADQVVDEMKRHRGNGEGEAASAHEHAVQGVVEDYDYTD